MNRSVIEIQDARKRIKDTLSEKQMFPYNKSLFLSTPIICFPEYRQLIGFSPSLIIRRFTEGIYFDLASESDFGVALGAAFENYVIETIKTGGCKSWDVSPEISMVKKGVGTIHTSDAIINTESCSIFIECKFNRPTHVAKFDLSDENAVDGQIDKFAGFFAQGYKAAYRACRGDFGEIVLHKDNIFLIIVSPDEWHLVSQARVREFEGAVKSKIPEELWCEDFFRRLRPIRCSMASFEVLVQACAQLGSANVMSKISTPESRWDFVRGHLINHYGKSKGFRPRKLWSDDFDDLIDLTLLA
ncbi:hypothetical protein AB6B38_11540 [Glycocaulis abyssi]|uniref:Restriction endonuclease n=1 Tax=Glycocaulis abyssi TaxID=1433403 RepID=A0ABV9NFZ4_9PROT